MDTVESKPVSPVLTSKTRRKLSKGMRVANYFYQLCMGLLSGINFTLIMFDKTVETIHINKTYFEVMSVVIAVIPILWSKILDSCKSINVHVPDTPKAAHMPKQTELTTAVPNAGAATSGASYSRADASVS